MTKAKSRARRILSLLMSMAMVLMMLVPAMALADDTTKYTITINPNASTLTPSNTADDSTSDLAKRFQAYQVFNGTLGNPSPTGTAGKPDAGQLGKVTWGSGIDPDKIDDLLTALLGSEVEIGTDGLGVKTTKPETSSDKFWTEDYNTAGTEGAGAFTVGEDTTLGALFAQALKQAGYTVAANNEVTSTTDVTLSKTAAVIVRVISDLNENTDGKNNSDLAYEFAKIVGQKTDSGYAFLSSTPATSTWKKSETGIEAHWEIGNLNPGYYLVLDTYKSPENTLEENVNSEYIIAVFANQTINIKSNAATVDKDIVTADGTAKGDSAGIGDTVKFRLTGTLAENYDKYDSYKYVFHDTLSAGLTYNANSVKVYAVKPAATDDSTPTIYDITGATVGTGTAVAYYTVKNSADTSTTIDCSLEVEFADLKATGLTGKKVNNYGAAPEASEEATPITLDYKWKIVVEYTATVNPEAVVVDPKADGIFGETPRNKNTVFLEYSNDPKNTGDGGSTGKTTEKSVYIYVYGEDVTKVDGTTSGDTVKRLAAGFALKRADGKYAVFKKTTITTDSDTNVGDMYTIYDWLTEEEIEGITGEDVWKNGFTVDTANTTNNGLGLSDGTYYLVFTTLTDNKPLRIHGLDADTVYTLTEKFIPAGYDKMDDITFKLEATIDDETGNLTKLEAKLSGDDRDDVNFAENNTSGYVPVTLKNMPSGYLPGTGGMGTVLFYAGGVIMLALGGMHILRRRNRRAAA